MVQALRERKKEQTRQALVAAGLQLFAERGFDSVTVADIAARADVAPRTFHRYFPDKIELAFADEARLRDLVRTALDTAPSGAQPAEQLISLLRTVGDALAEGHAKAVALDRLLRDVPALRARELAKRADLERLVAEHLAGRLGVTVDEDVRARCWAGIALATFHAAYQGWLLRGGHLRQHLDAAIACWSTMVPVRTRHEIEGRR